MNSNILTLPQLTAEALFHVEQDKSVREDDKQAVTPLKGIVLAGGRAPAAAWLRELGQLYGLRRCDGDAQGSAGKQASAADCLDGQGALHSSCCKNSDDTQSNFDRQKNTSACLNMQGGWKAGSCKNGRTLLYCADRGTQYALAAGLAPQLIVGDGDSAAADVYERALALGAALERYDPAKDDTDLQLLLAKLPAADIIASGVWGGRFDHLYSAVFSLLGWKKKQLQCGRRCRVLLADEREVMLLLEAGESCKVKFKAPKLVQAVSLLPLSADAAADIAGVRWPLNNAALRQSYPYAISNELAAGAEGFTAGCRCGSIGVYISFK